MPEGDVTGTAPHLVPDTLDLADASRLAINALLGSLDPEASCRAVLLGSFFMANPPCLLQWSSMYSGVLPMYLEALPLLRVASGNQDGGNIEFGILKAVAKTIEHDGSIYDEERPERPCNSGIGCGKRSLARGLRELAGNGRLIIGFRTITAWPATSPWLIRTRRTGVRMIELAIAEDRYPYYPNVGLGNDFSYTQGGRLHHPREPSDERKAQQEGAVLINQSQPIPGLVRYYKWTREEHALEIAVRLNALSRGLSSGAVTTISIREIGAARGHFWGHCHGHTTTLRGVARLHGRGQ